MKWLTLVGVLATPFWNGCAGEPATPPHRPAVPVERARPESSSLPASDAAEETFAAAAYEVEALPDGRVRLDSGEVLTDELYLERLAASAEIAAHVAKGKKRVTFDMKRDPPDDATLLAHILGPTGNLRAPTIKHGKTLYVGFSEDAYRELI